MDKQLSVKLPPSLTAETSVKIWEQVLGAESSGQTIFDASDLTFCDESGLTLLYELRSRPDAFKLINVSASIETLYNTMLKNFSPKPVEKKSLGVVSSLGKWLYDAASSTKQSIIFLGSACCALTDVLLHPSQIRFGEILSVSDEAGSRAVGIICLIDLPSHRLSPLELCIIFCEIDHLHATFAIGNGTYSGVGEGVLDDHR